MAATLELLRKSSSVEYRPLPPHRIFQGEEIITELQRMFEEHGTQVPIGHLDTPVVPEHKLDTNPYIPLNQTTLTRAQLEAILILGTGMNGVKIGMTLHPISVHENGVKQNPSVSSSLFASLEYVLQVDRLNNHHKIVRDPDIHSSKTYAIEQNGKATNLSHLLI